MLRPYPRVLVVALVVACGLLLSSSAFGFDVFVNGVRVTGLREQQLANCTVRFDAKGDIHITAKGYSVQAVEPRPRPRTIPKVYLIADGHHRQQIPFRVDVFINGRWVAKLEPKSRSFAREVTRYVRPGKNSVRFTATNVALPKGAKPPAATDWLRVALGTGATGARGFQLKKRLAKIRILGDHRRGFSEDRTFDL